MGQAREVMDRLTAAATEAHDVDKLAKCYADNAVVITPDAGAVKGRKQIGEYWRQFIDGFPDSRFESINKIESGNMAVDEGYFIGTNTGNVKLASGEKMTATGKKIKIRSCDVATVENGMVTEHHLYFDQEEFQRQLGLSG